MRDKPSVVWKCKTCGALVPETQFFCPNCERPSPPPPVNPTAEAGGSRDSSASAFFERTALPWRARVVMRSKPSVVRKSPIQSSEITRRGLS